MADTGAAGLTVPDAELVSLFSSFLDTWNRDPRAVWSSFSMIVVSEIGDKTFLIAAILAMRQPRPIVFLGAFGALAVMSILSSLLGVMFPTLLPKWLTTLLAAILFFVFGIKMFRDGLQMTGEELGEEWEEAEREVDEEQEALELSGGDERMELRNMEEGTGRERDTSNGHADTNGNSAAGYPQVLPYPPKSSAPSPLRPAASTASQLSGVSIKEGARNLCSLCFSPIFAQAFVLTFLGEWGDRSQIATIALAAAHNIVLVSFGTIVGHGLCTGLAVLGGRWIARRISIKHVTLGGATLFLLFGVIFLWDSRFGGSVDLAPISGTAASAPMGDNLAGQIVPGLGLEASPGGPPGLRIR